ncbi:hypothetical protein [Catenulispora pinisilvae]|nr:hypothetical protein [Catenulispora pinisilvae]
MSVHTVGLRDPFGTELAGFVTYDRLTTAARDAGIPVLAPRD